MTDLEFERIYKYVKSRYGIDLSRKREIIAGRMDNYIATHGYASYSEYLNAVESDQTGELEKILVDHLTTNHTFFMREFEHFEFLRSEILPELRVKEEKTRDIRIWCGAASTGEEPYMIAMLLMDYFGFDHANWNTQILATDVSEEALRKAINGVYTFEQAEVLPETWRRRYMNRVLGKEEYVVSNETKSQVLFRSFNLMNPLPFRKKLHVVFLRNVMIYFDQQTKNELMHRIYDALEPGGYLFVGKTETVDREAVPFEMVEPSIFRKPKGDV